MSVALVDEPRGGRTLTAMRQPAQSSVAEKISAHLFKEVDSVLHPLWQNGTITPGVDCTLPGPGSGIDVAHSSPLRSTLCSMQLSRRAGTVKWSGCFNRCILAFWTEVIGMCQGNNRYQSIRDLTLRSLVSVVVKLFYA